MTVDIQSVRETLKRRSLQRQQHLEELVTVAQHDVARIVEMLVKNFDPLRIYQWGSLLTPSRFREWSDIDLALEGLKNPLDGLRAADEAARLTDFSVDLVELDRIDERHADTIRNNGRLIYERK